MRIEACREHLFELFDLSNETPDEFGFTSKVCVDIQTLGYATNLTPEVVKNAIRKRVNLIVTHHDAWDFMYGMKEDCLRLMHQHGVSHVFVHSPLDMATFGPVNALTEKLGAQLGEGITNPEGILIGRIGVYRKPIEFQRLVKRMESLCTEKVMSWRNHQRLVRRICTLPGGAPLTNYMKEAVDRNCDVYITGEKTLYTVLYARYTCLNLIIGSHTFTEIFAVANLAKLLKRRFSELKVIRLREPHLEAQPMHQAGLSF